MTDNTENTAADESAAENYVHPKIKYPDLWAQKEKLEKEKDDLLAASKPHRVKVKKLREKMAEIQHEIDAEMAAVVEIERPRIVELNNQIAATARAMGARSLKAEPASQPIKKP